MTGRPAILHTQLIYYFLTDWLMLQWSTRHIMPQHQERQHHMLELH